jgi:hypothetical protein
MFMWIPGSSLLIPDEPKWNVTCSNWTDASHAAVYAPAA